MTRDSTWLAGHLRDVPDFPKPGIVFKDLTPLLGDVDAFRYAVDAIADHAAGLTVDKVVGIEARGFIFAAAVAYRLGAGFVPVRKPGKLPWKTVTETYDLEYGSDSLDIHEDAVATGDTVYIVDDVLATGGTAAATERARRARRRVDRRSRLRGRVGIPRRQGETARSRHTQPDHRVIRGTSPQHTGTRHPRAPFRLCEHSARKEVGMPTVDRVLPWRRNDPPPADEVAPLLSAFRKRHPKAPTALITRAYLQSSDSHRGQSRNSGEPYVQHPLAVAAHRRRPRPRRRHGCRRAAARHRRGHGHDARRDRALVRGRRRRHRRRRHQARAGPVRLQRGPAGRHHAQDAGGHGPRPAGPDHQARRPPPQHAHHRGDAGVEAGPHRP